MLLEFIAAIVTALAVGGLMHLLIVVSGRRLPRWLIPAGAGLGMLAFVIWSEYSWAARSLAVLPEPVVLASKNQSRAWFRPWTYVKPLTTRMILVDHRLTRRHAEFPAQRLVAVVLMERWAPTRQIPVLFDCLGLRRIDLLDGVRLAEDGRVEGGHWRELPADDPVLRAACEPALP